jgi:hypothetical protein
MAIMLDNAMNTGNRTGLCRAAFSFSVLHHALCNPGQHLCDTNAADHNSILAGQQLVMIEQYAGIKTAARLLPTTLHKHC